MTTERLAELEREKAELRKRLEDVEQQLADAEEPDSYWWTLYRDSHAIAFGRDPEWKYFSNSHRATLRMFAEKLRARYAAEPVKVDVEKAAERMTGAELIAAERSRQITQENWDSQHDDEHSCGTLSVIAAALAVSGTDARVEDPCDRVIDGYDCWGLRKKHGDNPIRCLAIAGALIAAEIDRLQRATILRDELKGATNDE